MPHYLSNYIEHQQKRANPYARLSVLLLLNISEHSNIK